MDCCVLYSYRFSVSVLNVHLKCRALCEASFCAVHSLTLQ